jgi:hypothetical protein
MICHFETHDPTPIRRSRAYLRCSAFSSFHSARVAEWKIATLGRCGSEVEPVSQDSDSLTHDEETHPKTVAPHWIARVKASKILGICSPAMPAPVSCTSMRTLAPECRQPRRMRPPAWVYLTALLTRLRRTALRRSASLSIDAH